MWMTAMNSGSSNYTSAELKRLYEDRFEGLLEYRTNVWQSLNKNFFQQFVDTHDTILDLGAGYCEFINTIRGGKKYAMDLNPDTVRHANKDVQVLTHDCSTPWPLPDASLDVVFTSNFFEHLPDKMALTRTLKEARRCLKPGGQLIAMGPNIKYIPGAYWDFLDHHIPLTEFSLSEALRSAGFRIEKCIPKFLPYTMASGSQPPVFFVALYLMLPFAWRIFGKQFLIVARTA
jgi:SAM-dependent methyltransferase